MTCLYKGLTIVGLLVSIYPIVQTILPYFSGRNACRVHLTNRVKKGKHKEKQIHNLNRNGLRSEYVARPCWKWGADRVGLIFKGRLIRIWHKGFDFINKFLVINHWL